MDFRELDLRAIFRAVLRSQTVGAVALAATLSTGCCPTPDPVTQDVALTDAEVAELAETVLYLEECEPYCGPSLEVDGVAHALARCDLRERRMELRCSYYVDVGGCGRRPPGLASNGGVETTDLIGALFADMAHFEAASVPAFEQLARELVAFGAPQSLVRRARRAVLDEQRHDVWTTALARRRGVEPKRPTVAEKPLRSLLEVAHDNAREGCVGETWAALELSYAASHAPTAQLRTIFARIGNDELEHAELSHELHAWMTTRLSASELEMVEAGRDAAFDELVDTVGSAHAPARIAVGLPNRDTAVRLAQSLRLSGEHS